MRFIAAIFRFCYIICVAIPVVVRWAVFCITKNQGHLVKLGYSINSTLCKLGPIFIKFGQVLSTRYDIVGDEIGATLSELRDNVPGFSHQIVHKILRKEFGADILEKFEWFDENPVAAASIAQVHKAQLKTGETVAVKILRPYISKHFERDINLLKVMCKTITLLFKRFKKQNFLEMIDTLEKIVRIEVDLRFEAASAEQLKSNMIDDINLKIPKIFWNLTSKSVMVQEWIEGLPADKKEELLAQGHNIEKIVKNLAVIFFNQAYRDGFFHADIHPGNIIVTKSGQIALIDFGIMGHLSYEDRIFVAKIIYGFVTKNYKMVADVHFEMNLVPSHHSREMFALACRSIGEPIVGEKVNSISIGKLLKQLFEISKQFDMIIQSRFFLLQKTIMTVEGTGMTLYPDVNMWQLAEPWIKNWAKQNFGLKSQIKKAKLDLLKIMHTIPNIENNMQKVVTAIESLNKSKEKESRQNKIFTLFYFIIASTIICIALLK